MSKQKPLSEMADFGYENMSEGDGYILDELKRFAAGATRALDTKAEKSELISVWRSAETLFATKSRIKELQDSILFLEGKESDKLKELQDSILFLEGKESDKLKELQDSILFLEGKESEKAKELQDAVMFLSEKSEYAADKITDFQNALNLLAASNDYTKVYKVDVEVSPAEMLALNATPKVLVNAPSANQCIEVVRVEFFLDFETAAYTGVGAGNDLSLEYSSSGQFIEVDTAGWLDQGSDQRRCAHHKDQHIMGLGESVTLKMLSGEILTGDSPLKVRVDFRIVDVLV